MARTYAHDGDTIIVGQREFRLHDRGDNNVELTPTPVVQDCVVCAQSAGEYTSSAGVPLCAACVNRGLAYIVAVDILDNIRTYDPDIARIVDVLREDDQHMRNSGMSYVDSLSSAWDAYRGDVAMMSPIIHVFALAAREPGSVT